MDQRLKKCEVCKIDATCLCFQCMSYFCDSCFKLSHNNEEFKPHKKEKIDYFLPIDLKCPEHKLYPLKLFCTKEKGNLYNFLFILFRIMLSLLSL